MTPTFNDSKLRVMARRARELKAKPWLKPVERKAKQRRPDYHVWSFDQSTDIDKMGGLLFSAGAKTTVRELSELTSAPTNRVDRITGTIEIGGRVQRWVLEVDSCNDVMLWIDHDVVMAYYDMLNELCIHQYENEIASIEEPHIDLSPDPNFIPPGQYVEGANEMKFWVDQDSKGIDIYMNDVRLFDIEANEKIIFIPSHIRMVAGYLQSYTYHGCQCNECGGGE